MNLLRFLNTVRNFQTDQIRQKVVYSLAKSKAARTLHRTVSCDVSDLFLFRFERERVYENGKFGFVITPHLYNGNAPWNELKHGALWNIRLNSFEYLSDPELNVGTATELLKNFIRHSASNRTLYDSYCVSQRILNWTAFISKHAMYDQEILDFIYKQAHYLSVNPEFHLRNNHLIENGFALLRAGVFFRQDKFLRIAERILRSELEKQILGDGAHFELCPMYQCILLRGLLESIDLLRQYHEPSKAELLSLMEEKAGMMCGWLKNIAFDNGQLPQLNDSADETHTWKSLFHYAGSLGIRCRPRALGQCGYRKFRNRHFEMLVDINGLTPSLAPGHGHADTFHFLLHVFGSPFIIDTGVSTYSPGPERMYERSTSAHNTVVIGERDQSEVYGSFRVGRKTSVFNIREDVNSVSGSHNGYKVIGAIHHRRFDFGDREIVITDTIDPGSHHSSTAYFHVHKNCFMRLRDGILISKFVQMGFEGATSVQLCDTWNAPAFGIRLPSRKVRVDFTGQLITRISLP